MKIHNYKVIEDVEINFKRINIIFGQNGIGKSTLKEVLKSCAKGVPISDSPNINSFEKTSIVSCQEVVGLEPFIFDEEYVSKYVFSQASDSLVRNEQYQVLLPSQPIEELTRKNDDVNRQIKEASELLSELIGKFTTHSTVVNNYISEEGSLQTKLRNITKKEVLSSHSKDLLDFARKPSEMYIWWNQGYQNFWNPAYTNCIFCDQSISSSPIATILKDKSKNTFNPKTQIDTVNSLNGMKEICSKTMQKEIDDFTKAIVASSVSDQTQQLQKSNDKILAIKQLLERILSKKAILKMTRFSFNVLIDPGELSIHDYEDVLSDEYKSKVSLYNVKVADIKKNIDEFNKYIAKGKSEFSKIISGNETLFNSIMKRFGLNYSIKIDSSDVDSESKSLTYQFFLENKDASQKQDIANGYKTVMSFGEKNTLAFSFFLLDTLNHLKNRTNQQVLVILDDPISSHDIFRKYNTVDILNDFVINNLHEGDRFVLFTHEFEFILPLMETIHKPNKDISTLSSFSFENGKTKIKDITRRDLSNSLTQFVKIIKTKSAQPLSIYVMLRIIREIDCSIRGITKNTDSIFGYLSSVLHSDKEFLAISEEEINEFLSKFKINEEVFCFRTRREYNRYMQELDLSTLKGIDKYFIIRPFLDFLMSGEDKKIDLEHSYKNFSNSEVVSFIDTNFSFLNSSVHPNENEDIPTVFDFKEFELFSGKIFDEFLKLVSPITRPSF